VRPSVSPTVEPTSEAVITDRMIFGFDVGSTSANVFTLILLIIVILWLGLSIAYCITRKDSSSTAVKTGRNRSRKQKFEEYWGDINDSAHSTSTFDLESSSHSSLR
jgi:hypothetical protein